jgi:hypothetical protein
LPRIVAQQQFAQAQSLLHAERKKPGEEELLSHLRRVWRANGRLTSKLVVQANPEFSFFRYASVFGSFRRAYQLIGYTPRCDFNAMALHKSQMREHRQALVEVVSRQCKKVGAEVICDRRAGVIRINEQLTAGTVVVPFVQWRSHRIPFGWVFNIFFNPPLDLIVAARLDKTNDKVESYYIIPKIAGFSGQFWVAEQPEPAFLEAYRARNLVPLLETVVMYDLAESNP